MKRVKIKMLKSAMGSDRNNEDVAMPNKLYKCGEVCMVGESLAKCFCQMKVAEDGSVFERPTKEYLTKKRENKAK